MARPTDFTPELLAKAREYLTKKLPRGEVLHTIEGLALYIGVARSTVYEWAKDASKVEFSDIFDDIMAKQSRTLINGGLSERFNSTITKVMLTKHGYREGIENTGEGGGPVKVDITDQLNKVYGGDGT